jgi:hypothetical protein
MKKTITLQIDDQKFDAFRSFIETLDYVSVIDDDLPEWQKEEIDRRLKLLDSGKMSSRNWKEAKKDIFDH